MFSPTRSTQTPAPTPTAAAQERHARNPSVLTEEMVLARTGKSRLNLVTHLNYWRNQLVDISILNETNNLRILSLSFNQIRSLESLAHCIQLQELYVRHNNIGSELIDVYGATPHEALIQELQHLRRSTQLSTLWVCENPCSSGIYDPREYRSIVVHVLPSVTRLDDMEISKSDRVYATEMASHRRPSLTITPQLTQYSAKPSSRPPTPFATSHEDAIAVRSPRSRGRSPAAAVSIKPLLNVETAEGRGASKSRSRSRSRLVNSVAVSPGGENYSPQDVRRVVPPHIRTPTRERLVSPSRERSSSPVRSPAKSFSPMRTLLVVPANEYPDNIASARSAWPQSPNCRQNNERISVDNFVAGSLKTGALHTDNILRAVVSLVRELDDAGLAVVEKEVLESRRGRHRGGM